MLWRSGPFGDLELIYTPWAIIFAQGIIAFPIITGFTAAALSNQPPALRLRDSNRHGYALVRPGANR